MRQSSLPAIALAALICALVPVASAAASAPDTTPPVTTCDAPFGWQKAPFAVHFSSVDAGSGVATTWAAVDGGAPLDVGGPSGASLDVPAPADHSFDGAHTLTYCSTDVAGNAEAARTIEVKVDTTGPTTSVRSTVGYAGRAVTLRYSVRDRLSPDAVGATLTVTDASGQVVAHLTFGDRPTGTWCCARWTPSAPGTYHISVVARDLAGNEETAADGATVIVRRLARVTIGRSVQRRPITVTQFGSGERRLLVVGGVHGNESGAAVAR